MFNESGHRGGREGAAPVRVRGLAGLPEPKMPGGGGAEERDGGRR